jgi:hypothetical protein
MTIFVAGKLLGWHNARLLKRLDKRLKGAGKPSDNRMDDCLSQLEQHMYLVERRMQQNEQTMIVGFEDLKVRFADLKETVVGRLEIRKA